MVRNKETKITNDRPVILQHYFSRALHARSMASVSAIIASLFSMQVNAADQQLWLNGSAFDPAAHIARNLPVPAAADLSKWIRNDDGIDIKDASGNVITSVEQFKQLLDNNNNQILHIVQKDNKTVLNWDSFDINANYTVQFHQPKETSIALNRIAAGASPSYILGNLEANGGVYLVNPNGVVFGKDSRVDVGSLVASTLDIDADLFLERPLGEILKNNNKAAFSWDGKQSASGKVLKFDEKGILQEQTLSVAAANANPLRGDIAIMDGAKITSSNLNGVAIVAPNVLNDGHIETPNGQSLLVAVQDEAYVLFSNDPGLRGLLVEVKNGGNLTNLGEIIAERGNITLAGLAVNHGGSIRATTSVDFNGTVRLLARDKAVDAPRGAIDNINKVSALLDPSSKAVVAVGEDNPNHLRVATHGGTVTLGTNSRIEITPEASSTATAPDAQKQRMSGVEISGANIQLQRDATITARGGDVFLDAINDLSTAYQTDSFRFNLPANSSQQRARIVLEAGATIDVSGTHATLAMERNQVEVELRGNELADAPLQRDGFLKGKTVTVDIREGTPLADITPALATVPKGINERLVNGGSVRLRSEGEVILQPDATLDVSGGGIHYTAGYISTTKLLSAGHVIDIGAADPNRTYDGMLGSVKSTNKRFNITETYNNFFIDVNRGKYVEAFDQGAAAGAVVIESQAAYLQGDIHAGINTGTYQRSLDQRPRSGSISLDLNLQSIAITRDSGATFDLDESLLETDPERRVNQRNEQGLYAQALLLSEQGLNASGAGTIALKARTGSIQLEQAVDLHLVDGARLQLQASEDITVAGRIRTAGGSVSVETGNYASDFAPISYVNLTNRAINLTGTAQIDTSGFWTNDNPLLAPGGGQNLASVVVNAGAVSLRAAGDLRLDEGSGITANAGGWLKANGKLAEGKGGDITLSAVQLDSPDTTTQQAAHLILDGELSSYGFSRGGKLSLTAPSVYIGNPDANQTSLDSHTLVLGADFFTTGGFSDYGITAKGSKNWVSEFRVGEFTDLSLKMQNYGLGNAIGELSSDSSKALLPTGASLVDSLGIQTLPDYLRKAVDLTLALDDKSSEVYHQETGYRHNYLGVETGVRISADPKATIALNANTFMVFDGIINAKGGKVALNVAADMDRPIDFESVDDTGIWIGKNSFIDVSAGFVQGLPTPEGLTAVGEVINAGSISLATNRGFVIAEAGSILDLSGALFTTERLANKGDGLGATRITDTRVASAGSLVLKAAEGVILDGELHARAGNATGAGGHFSLDIKAPNLPTNIGDGSGFEDYDFSKFSYADRQIILHQQLADSDPLSATLDASKFGQKDSIPDALNATTHLSLEQLMSAGFDAYTLTTGFTARPTTEVLAKFRNPDPQLNALLKAQAEAASGIGKIVFKDDLSFVADKSIHLNTTTLVADGGRAVVAAPYLKVGYSDGSLDGRGDFFNPGLALGGAGELVLMATNFVGTQRPATGSPQALHETFADLPTADLLVSLNHPSAGGLLDLVGRTAVQGADQVSLGSAGDIRTSGLLVGEGKGDFARYLGSFTVNKDLTLQADQIYPTTLSEFIFASGQRDFSLTGATIFEPVPGSNQPWNLVSTHNLSVEFTHPTTGEKTVETLSPTWYEAYDLLSGVLGVGGNIYRQQQGNNKVIQQGVVLAVNETPVLGNAAGKIRILEGGQSTPVLSAGGSLILDAPSIAQGGVLKAPFGQITFNARTNERSDSGQVTFTEASLTSVSADKQIIPFGEIDSTDHLVYRTNPKADFNSQRLFNQSPSGSVTIQADHIDLRDGSTVDLSGGGDLLATRFVPGPGGSKDVLAPGAGQQSFAIIPTLKSPYAPFDPAIHYEAGLGDNNLTSSFGLAPGASVYLAGTNNVPAGEYVILPARYALLPGAYLVTPLNDGKVYSPGQNLRQIDGTPVIAGRYLTANTQQQDSLMSGFILEPGEIARTRSEYIVRRAAELFAPAVTDTTHRTNPNDAGSLVLLAGKTLNLNSDIRAVTGKDGLGAQLDIASEQLAVVNQLGDAGVGDAVQLVAGQLNTGGFNSVLLGGRRTSSGEGLSIRADSRSVVVAQDVQLELPELILVAKGDHTADGSIVVEKGARLEATGTSQPATTAKTVATLLGDTFLRVSTGNQFDLTQSSDTLGNINIHAGAITEATGSQMILSNGATVLDGDIIMPGGSLAIGSGLISLGDAGDVAGLKFTNGDLAALQADEIVLTSATSIDLYGAVTFDAKNLVLKTGAIQGFGRAGETATIVATDNLTLEGLDTAYLAPANSVGGSGNIRLSARQLTLGDGHWAMQGFEQVNLDASQSLVGESSGQLDVYANQALAINTPLLTGKGAADTRIFSAGALMVNVAGTTTSGNAITGLGARFTLAGESLDFAGHALLPSGQLNLLARGLAGDDLRISTSATIDLAGKNVRFDGQTVASHGGALGLTSNSGNVVLEQGATINLSGISGAKGSDAGQLHISALQGEFQSQATLIADAGSQRQGASLDLSVFAIPDLSALLQKISAGKFTETVSLRTGSGDIAIGAGDNLRARHITLTADQGSISIAGTLEAQGSGEGRNSIQLNARNEVHLQSGARLLARAVTNQQVAGDVLLATTHGHLQLDAGAKIDVTGGGEVTLRTPRLQDGAALAGGNVGNDVAVVLPVATYLGDLITGADRINVNAVKTHEVQYTSEIFNTDSNGNSTLSQAYATLPYRLPIPVGAICEAGECVVIESATIVNGSPDIKTITVAGGEPLPAGYLCGDLAGCSYSYKVNDEGASIANSETRAFMTHADAIETRLFGLFSIKDNFHLQPELELQSQQDLVVDEAIDFGRGLGVLQQENGGAIVAHDTRDSWWRFNDEQVMEYTFDPAQFANAEFERYTNGEAGVLSLRAQGNIRIDATISDGFAERFSYEQAIATQFVGGPRSELTNEAQGWSYRLVAGAALDSANALATTGIGDMQLGENLWVRTGVGDLTLVAANNIHVGESTSIYTAGRSTGGGFYADLARQNGDFNLFDYSALSNVVYAEAGGDIRFQAGGDITALGTQLFVTDWLHRIGAADVDLSRLAGTGFAGVLPTTWAVSPDDFTQGIATLGGGDIHINAGKTINNLSVSLPTTGKNTSALAPIMGTGANSNIQVLGGGDLVMKAGQDILSAQVFVARGNASLQAGGDISGGQQGNHTLLELADGNISLAAAGDINIANIINPTIARLSTRQAGTDLTLLDMLDINANTGGNFQNYFFTYAPDAGISATALSGNVIFSAANQLQLRANQSPFVTGGEESLAVSTVFAPRLEVRALQGDIRFDQADMISLYPSAQGGLSLLAANNLIAQKGAVLNVPDTDPAILPDSLKPTAMFGMTQDIFKVLDLADPSVTANLTSLMHASTPLYLNNPEPVRLVAATGDITNLRLVSPTVTHVTAGRDITNVTFEFQHLRPSDISVISAGRDLLFSTPRNPSTNALDFVSSTQGIDIGGSGRLDVIAGGNIQLGSARGIQSIGAANNPNLLRHGFTEEAGADITLLAGIKHAINYAGFSEKYLASYQALPQLTDTAQLIAYLQGYRAGNRKDAEQFIKWVSGVTRQDYYAGARAQSLSDDQIQQTLAAAQTDLATLDTVKQQQIAFRVANPRANNYTGDLIEFVTSERFGAQRLDATTLLGLSLAEQHQAALAAFSAAPVEIQRELALHVYFNEVRQGGIEDVSGLIEDAGRDGFARSYAAIETLFPGSYRDDVDPKDYSGDISLVFSTVQTQQGGDINLIAPGGSIDVGVAALGGGVTKPSSSLGLIALRSGYINATVNDNINVNSSRVFALDGGDISLWSSYGDLDAGRGAKTALSVPPPIVNSDGSINFQAAVAGSGIRNSRFTANRAPGAVYLFAPDGVVNAGDAGIGSQGDVLIAAQQVIGADNIDVGGISIGIPVTTGISAGLAGVSASATAAGDSSTDQLLEKDLSASVDQRRPAFVTIDILGLDF